VKRLPFELAALSLSEVGSKLLGLVAITYLARTLGPEGVGIIALGTAILMYGSICSDLGLPILGTRSAAGGKINIGSLRMKISSARFLLSVSVALLGSVLLWILITDTVSRDVAIFYLIGLLPASLTLDWLFQGIRKIGTLALARILGMATYLVMVLALVGTSNDMLFVPIAWGCGVAVQALFLWLRSQNISPSSLETKPLDSTPIKLIREAVPLGFANLIAQVVLQFPIIYLTIFESSADAGFYSIAFRVIVVFLMLDRVYYTLFFPIISRSVEEGRDVLHRRFYRAIKFIALIGFFLGTVFIISGSRLFPLLFGNEFRASVPIFDILVIYFILTLLSSTLSFTLIALKKEKLYTRSLIIGAIGFAGILLLPLPGDSQLVAPLALVVFQLIAFLAMVRHLQNEIPFSIERIVLFPMLVIMVILTGGAMVMHLSPLFVSIAVIIIALPALLFSIGFNRDDWQFIKKSIL
jgi:O-antigen/teichoic acid export membrane protein